MNQFLIFILGSIFKFPSLSSSSFFRKLGFYGLILFLSFFGFCKKGDETGPVSIPAAKEEVSASEQDYESVPEQPKKSPGQLKDLTIGPHTVIAPSGLMLRAEPRKDSVAIVKMLKNMKAEILEYSPKEDEFEGNRARWAKVKYKKYTGWAFSYYLKPEKGSTLIEEKAEK